MLINASEKFTQLKKSKGSKRKEVDAAHRQEIVQTLSQFKDNDYARVFEKEFFYFNKQAILLTNVDEAGKSLADALEDDGIALPLTPIKLENGERTLTEFTITAFDAERFETLQAVYEGDIKPFIGSLDYKEQPVKVTTAEAMYWFDAERETLMEEALGKREALGCGKIVVNASFKKKTKKLPERIVITAELTLDTQKDYEIIPFHRDELENTEAIEAFMAKYITKPFEYLDNVVGVEINFNKVFYKPEKLRNTAEVLQEISDLDIELNQLEQEFSL